MWSVGEYKEMRMLEVNSFITLLKEIYNFNRRMVDPLLALPEAPMEYAVEKEASRIEGMKIVIPDN